LFSKEFQEEPLSLILLIYLYENSNSPIEFSYKQIESDLNISKYKQKKALEFLQNKNMLNIHREFSRQNKTCLAEVNLDNPLVKGVVGNLKKQGELITGLTREDLTRELDDNPLLTYPFKISGNKGRTIMDYGMQKYIKAFFGKISWDKVTYRDLACVLAMSAGKRHKDMFFYQLKKANWAGKIIKKYFNHIEKRHFLSVAVEFVKEYEKSYDDGQGLNWNYIDKHTQHRKKLLTKAEKNVILDERQKIGQVLWE